MDAFFSGTDDANENMTQFYAVWGKVTSNEPAFTFRWVCGDKKVVCSPDILIDWPVLTYSEQVKTITHKKLSLTGETSLVDVEQLHAEKVDENETAVNTTIEIVRGPFKEIEYPADWMTQHSTRTYSYGGYGRSTYRNSIGKTAQSKKLEYEYDPLLDGYDYYDEVGWGAYDTPAYNKGYYGSTYEQEDLLASEYPSQAKNKKTKSYQGKHSKIAIPKRRARKK